MSRRASDSERESLVERATHDLLNPVAAILGLSETIRARGTDLPDATLRELASAIGRQASVFEDSIRDLARATGLEREDPPVKRSEVSLGEIARAFPSDRVRVDADPDVTASADAELLTAALRRLVTNALEHSTEEVVVRAGRDGGSIYLEVLDTGCGFTPEGLAASFDPLSAGTNVRGERGRGLGLGLHIAKRLVEAQGGTLEAESEPQRGSRFRIVLPA